MNAQRRMAMFSLSVAAIAAACTKPPPPPPPAPAPTTTAPVTPRVNQDSIDAAARRARATADSIQLANQAAATRAQRMRDSVAEAARMAAENARASDAMKATLATVVHFEYDRFELRDDTKAALDAKIPILNANPSVTLRISGHADDRGSGEYNLQLGQRRAAAVRDYLTARGVAAARMELVSYGEERPLCKEAADGCWSQNRRAEFEITAGGAMLRKP